MNKKDLINYYKTSVDLIKKNPYYPDEETWFYNSIIGPRDELQEYIDAETLDKDGIKEIHMTDNELRSSTYSIDKPFFSPKSQNRWWYYIIPKMPLFFMHSNIEKNLDCLKSQGFILEDFTSKSMYPNFFSSDDPEIKYQPRSRSGKLS